MKLYCNELPPYEPFKYRKDLHNHFFEPFEYCEELPVQFHTQAYIFMLRIHFLGYLVQFFRYVKARPQIHSYETPWTWEV